MFRQSLLKTKTIGFFITMSNNITRRHFVKGAALASASMPFALNTSTVQAEDAKAETPLKPLGTAIGTLPMAKIGKQEFSRLMLGGNLITGYAHARDLGYVSELMKHYNTEAKILDTLEAAELQGINAVNTSVGDDSSFLRKHAKRGGKMKWIAQASPQDSDLLADFKKAIDLGAAAVHIQGHGAEKLVEGKEMENLGKIIEYLKSQGVVAGVAAHSLDVIVQCEKAKIAPDFYQKTLHTREYHSAAPVGEKSYLGRYDNSWCNDAEEVAEVMFAVKKPWIAFKVMAAGAIPPRKAFQYAFDNGADFVLAGMFDWQVSEDVKIVKEVLASVKRTRPWMA